jgi:polyhydroxyalkanoate synthesis regulator phasin
MARKTDQELMWEVFMEASNGGVITTGGPLKAGGGSSAPKSEDAEDVDGDPYEDEEGEDKLKSILDKCHSGDISADEAHEHITKMMKSGMPKEDEEGKNVKRHSMERNTKEMISQFTKDKSAANVKRPKPAPNVLGGFNRDTTKTQGGI